MLNWSQYDTIVILTLLLLLLLRSRKANERDGAMGREQRSVIESQDPLLEKDTALGEEERNEGRGLGEAKGKGGRSQRRR